MTLISTHMSWFIELLTTVGLQKGNKWDDLVVMHEWTCKMDKFRTHENEELRSAMVSHKYKFSAETAAEWLNE